MSVDWFPVRQSCSGVPLQAVTLYQKDLNPTVVCVAVQHCTFRENCNMSVEMNVTVACYRKKINGVSRL